MSSGTDDRNEHQWEELRLGLIMNGGVSLAVWMGGVSNEIFRLVTRQHPVYQGLMELTRTSARVDVISGTSAGGVNGAALAVALLYGGDFSQLRQVWMETGAFASLLRKPTGKNPGSLLQGEEFYLKELTKAFESLSTKHTSPCFAPEVMPIDLRLTTTLLSGHQGRNVDDLGIPVHDVDYRAQFHFERKAKGHGGDGPPSVFDDRAVMIRALARAARSTSSFPFAFEPSLISPDDAGPWLVNAQQAELKTPRFAVDGGIMDNKPFRGAREAIFEMPRRAGVRRVLAYINPDPGDGKPFDLPAKPVTPQLSQVLAASIIGIPQSQSIADELQEIEAHNLNVRMRRESVLSLAATFKASAGRLEAMASDLFEIYRNRRLSTTFELFVFQPLSNAVARKPELARSLSLIGKYGKETLKNAFEREAGRGWLPDRWPGGAYNRCNRCSEQWGWGLFPVEFASKLMMNMLRMMQSVAEYQDRSAGRGGKDDAADARSDATEAATPPPGADWSDSGQEAWRPDSLAMELQRVLEPTHETLTALKKWWDEAYGIVNEILAMRDTERAHWREKMDLALVDLSRFSGPVSATDLAAWQTRTVNGLFSQISGDARRAMCADLANRIATVIREIAKEIPALVKDLPGLDAKDAPSLLQPDREAVKALNNLSELFNQQSVQKTLYKVLQMEVVEFAFNDHESLNADSTIELVQISGNGQSALGGNGDATDKLLGLQLAHFGAFYKESWRANDWLYGRLDGASRLIRVLLNARRLHQIFAHQSHMAFDAIRGIAKNSLDPGPLRSYLDEQWRVRGLDRAIQGELRFLDTPQDNVPDLLPHCVEAIEMRMHLAILRDELEPLAQAVVRDQTSGADAMWSGKALVDNLKKAPERSDAPFSPQQAVAALQSGLLAGPAGRGENFTKEAGSDLFTRTLAHTVATLQNTLSSKAANLGPVSVLFAGLWLPTLGFHFVAQGLTRQSRTAAALHGAMLTTGLALVILGFIVKGGLDGPVVQIGWLLFAFGFIISVVRAPRFFVGLAAVTALALSMVVLFKAASPVHLVSATLLVLLAVSTYWTRLQAVVACLAIALAAVYSTNPPHAAGDLQIGVVSMGILVAVTIGIAVLQATDTLPAMEQWLRLNFARPPYGRRSDNLSLRERGDRIMAQLNLIGRAGRSPGATSLEPLKADLNAMHWEYRARLKNYADLAEKPYFAPGVRTPAVTQMRADARATRSMLNSADAIGKLQFLDGPDKPFLESMRAYLLVDPVPSGWEPAPFTGRVRELASSLCTTLRPKYRVTRAAALDALAEAVHLRQERLEMQIQSRTVELNDAFACAEKAYVQAMNASRSQGSSTTAVHPPISSA
ncbi:patatin-like protein [Variovorax fucosicus]|uniref:patatin-like protein n=1 Tax=Variovorax fucosicus TaxID=3053517 RepID=UPI0025773BE8|nr:patatin-like protein [Variovorax sp. J22G47]MDM0059008.1 patatin-like protein [Variovorax sp. J22G47]